MRVVVTGGFGFIGAVVVRRILDRWPTAQVTNLDKGTYAADPSRLEGVDSTRLRTVAGDVADPEAVGECLDESTTHVIHLAAESHVDRAIGDPAPFVRTNVLGTQVLIDAALGHRIPHFLLVSTDEVYGDAGSGDPRDERATLAPSNPYAASKAAAELFVRAAGRTHGLPFSITRGCNTTGSSQHPEKLLGQLVRALLEGRPFPLYGDGTQIREWMDVDDHADGIVAAACAPAAGHTWNLGSGVRLENRAVARIVAESLNRPDHPFGSIPDRPGHDRRYAIDSTAARTALGWSTVRDPVAALAAATRGMATRLTRSPSCG